MLARRSTPAHTRHLACVRAGAGIVGMSATYPMDMVRGRITIQEASNQQYRGLLHATGVIIRCVRGRAGWLWSGGWVGWAGCDGLVGWMGWLPRVGGLDGLD